MTDPHRAAAEQPIAPRHRGRAMACALTVCLFLIVLGGKLIVLDRFGSDIPNWDQWDAEGNVVLLPYLQGRLQWADLTSPHNEHRTVPSKLLALGLVVANGQWDSRLECVVNALLHAALAAAIFGFGRACLGGRWTAAWFAAVAAFMAPPVAWQNVLGGFHSQQLFVLAFTALAFVFLLRARTGSPGWWLGLAFAGIAIVSQGSGLLVGAVVAALLAVRDRPTIALRQHGVTIAACLLLFALGWWLRVEVAYHEQLKAKSAADFFWTVWRSLQWPARSFVAFPLLAWLPWTWLTWQVVVRRRWADSSVLVIVAVGVWSLLNYAAAGYARGAGGEWPASRYFDTVAFGIVANLLALLVAFSRAPLQGWRRWTRAGLGLAGVALLGQGLWLELDAIVTRELPYIVSLMREREFNTRAYLITGERTRLDNVEIPFPNADILADRLSHPEIRTILPASIRPPLPVRGEADPTGSFSTDGVPPTLPDPAGEPRWGSFTADAAGRRGAWRSELLPAGTGGFWQIRVAGTLDHTGVALAVVGTDGRVIAPLTPQPAATTGWTTVTIRAPDEPCRLLARDADAAGWLAFTGPTVMATGSYYAWQLARQGGAVLIIGLIAAMVTLVIDAIQQWQLRCIAHTGAAVNVSRAGAAAVAATLTIGSAIATATFLAAANQRLPEAWFELTATTNRETTIQLFVSDGRRGFRGSDGAQIVLRPSPEPQSCRLRLPGGTIGRIRFDPAQDDQVLDVAGLRIVDAAGRVLRSFAADDLNALNQIARIEAETSGSMRIIPASGSNDPHAELRLAAPLRAARTSGHLVRTLLFPVGLVLLVGAFATAGVWHFSPRRWR